MKRICVLALSLFLLAGCTTPAPSTMIWVEGDGNRFYDENGVRRIAVNYKEIDLAGMVWDGRAWDDLWPGIEPLSDLTQFLDHGIAAREDAARIAAEVMASEQGAGNRAFADAIELAQVAYDANKGIWVITYWQNRPGSDLSIALDGKTGGLIRIWSYGE